MKKAPVVVGLLILFISLLSACGGGSSETNSGNTDSDGDTIDLTWYYPVNVGGEVTKVIDDYAESFNKEGVEVNGKKGYG